MAAPGALSPEKIAKHEFDQLLAQYPALAEAISQSKGGKSSTPRPAGLAPQPPLPVEPLLTGHGCAAKNGQKTLQALDQYRYVDALETFCREDPRRDMSLDNVKTLVEWKLRHGKFRPSLMGLVSSNAASSTSLTIRSALQTYRSKSDIAAALDTLASLKGVGPATASLLLSVHDPTRIIFFSDEAFHWLCCQGKKSPIKYSPKEYLALRAEAERLAQRLNVSATDIEKVAYVFMRRSEPLSGTGKSSATTKKRNKSSPNPSGKRKAVSSHAKVAKKDARDKTTQEKVEEEGLLRRSKRLRS